MVSESWNLYRLRSFFIHISCEKIIITKLSFVIALYGTHINNVDFEYIWSTISLTNGKLRRTKWIYAKTLLWNSHRNPKHAFFFFKYIHYTYTGQKHRSSVARIAASSAKSAQIGLESKSTFRLGIFFFFFFIISSNALRAKKKKKTPISLHTHAIIRRATDISFRLWISPTAPLQSGSLPVVVQHTYHI